MRILVTGDTGFIGKHLVKFLSGHEVVKQGVDLTDGRATLDFFRVNGPFDIVYHLAGYNGGIALNVKEPGTIFYRNTMMGLNVLEASRLTGVGKVVSAVASCAFPAEHEVLAEKEFLNGPPHPSVVGHAYAKRNLQVMGDCYRKEFGLQAICVCPTTVYGPGSAFDSIRSKLVCGMVARFVEATRRGDKTVTCWGTGSPYREVIYVEDAVKYIAMSAALYNDSSEILNIGTGQEYTVKQIAEKVAEAAGFTGIILWDSSKPDGQHRKKLDTSKMREVFGHISPTPFEVGLKNTVRDYCERRLP